MDWVPLVTAVLGALGGTGWSRLQMAGRLRQQLIEEVSLMNSLPEGTAKAELTAHVESRVRLLVAEQEGHTANERLTLRWASASVLVAMLAVVMIGSGIVSIGSDWARATVLVLLLLFMGVWMAIGTRVHESRTERRWEKRRLAESAQTSKGARPD